MNYKRIYYELIFQALERTIGSDEYSERHHIHPRCLGGDDSEENIVRLYPEEHFLAHALLVKIYPGVRGLIFAMLAMTMRSGKQLNENKRVNNKLFGWMRRELSIVQRGKIVSEETRRKMSESHLGMEFSEEHKKNLSLAKQNLSEEYRQNMSRARRACTTDEYRENCRLAKLGKTQTEEHIEKSISSLRGKKRPAEVGQKVSASKKGVAFTEEHKEALSKGWEKRKSDPDYVAPKPPSHKGKKQSPESIAKRVEARRRNKEAKLEVG